jgi:voltage-gated potassium channel
MGLALELMVSAILLVIVTTIHGTGIGLMDKLLRTDRMEISSLRLAQREIGVMIPMALFLLCLHIVEIFIFAGFYLATDDAHTVHEAIYHSALAYTTMGVVEGAITKWTLVSTFEGLAGFLMIGWSSAVFVTDMDRLLRNREK